MENCPFTWEILLNYADGHSSEEMVDDIANHLRNGCEECRLKLEVIVKVLASLKAVPLQHAPETVQSQARALFRTHQAASAINSVRTFIARLVFDSDSLQNAAFARGESPAGHQRLYRTPDHDIELWEDRVSGQESYLIGQALPRDGGVTVAPDQVTLKDSQGNTRIATIDTGEFHLPATRPGTYSLSLSFRDREIVLPDIVVGQ